VRECDSWTHTRDKCRHVLTDSPPVVTDTPSVHGLAKIILSL